MLIKRDRGRLVVSNVREKSRETAKSLFVLVNHDLFSQKRQLGYAICDASIINSVKSFNPLQKKKFLVSFLLFEKVQGMLLCSSECVNN